MTRASVREYAAVRRERYPHATRAEKHRLSDETVAVTGMHRKAAIRLLRRAPRVPTARSRVGRPRCYGPHVDRFASQAAYAQLTRVYDLARLHVNFLQPV